jgi:hypothetical protein
MAKCPAITGKGKPCEGFVYPSKTYCPAHDPARTEARRKAASKAGRSKTCGELSLLKQKLITLGDDVLAGRIHRGDAAVAVTAYGTAAKVVEAGAKVRELEEARLVETQLRIEEQREIVQRMEELEQVLQNKEGNRWGA